MINDASPHVDDDYKPAIRLENVQFAYQSSELILDVPAWLVERGKKVFVYGPSGCGKTTLLNLLAGVHAPSQGLVNVLGKPIGDWKGAQRDRFRARHIGMIFQQFNLIPWLSVADNIVAAHYFAKSKENKAHLEHRMIGLLGRLGIPESMLKRHANDLSVGQQQRVAIARALINQPELIIADEPTSSLDAEARDGFIELLNNSVGNQGGTLIFVSHDRSLSRFFDELVDLQALNSVAKDQVNAH